jgi:hypothetical protein
MQGEGGGDRNLPGGTAVAEEIGQGLLYQFISTDTQHLMVEKRNQKATLNNSCTQGSKVVEQKQYQ